MLEFSLGIVYSVGFDKYVMMCINHYNITQNSFTALYSIYSSLSPPEPQEITDLFTVSLVLPFPECHIVVIVTVWSLFRLASFTSKYVFKGSSCLFMT